MILKIRIKLFIQVFLQNTRTFTNSVYKAVRIERLFFMKNFFILAVFFWMVFHIGERIVHLLIVAPYDPVFDMRIYRIEIAKDLSLSRSTVKRAVKDLEKAGLIRKEPHYRENGSATSNRYYLL